MKSNLEVANMAKAAKISRISREEEKERILGIIKKEDVKFVLMQFMDILGSVKCVIVPQAKVESALSEGITFDGSSIVGYATIEESDMKGVPDLSTFRIFPPNMGDIKTAGIICNAYDHKGTRSTGDPRYVLEMMMNKVAKMGHIHNTGPEYEFFLFKLDSEGRPTNTPADAGRYFDLMPMDVGELVRKKSSMILDDLCFEVEASHHEVAPSQHEIDLKYADAMTSADRVLILKHVIKTVALQHNLHATFMPKPIFGVNGSGMHVHQSLLTPNGKNAFYDPDGKFQLSNKALWFIGGTLRYARETCAVLASWVNSYKRLVPGYEAPVYISWANMNRTALVRVPAGRGMKTRVEVRNPDPAGNPYLQYAVMLAAGLKGIEKKIEPPEPVEANIYKLTTSERKKLKIGSLPANLSEALDEMEQSELMKETLGGLVFTHYLYIKRKEWDEYRTRVTDWEIEKYLPVL
jgi:glutamine synthetase